MAKFITGNIPKHINNMTFAWAIWILSIFLVDFVDMYFLSQLWQSELAASVWFAGLLVFMVTSVWIALMITMASLVSRFLWAKDTKSSQNIAGSIFYFTFLISLPITVLLYIFSADILVFMWASWDTLKYAIDYFQIVVFVIPFMLLWMSINGLLRAIWDAKMSMMPTLLAGFVNIILDPILIFWFDLWIQWAAYATAASRITLFWVWIYGLIKYDFLHFWKIPTLFKNMKNILSIFIPAVVTNISTPIWSSFLLKNLSAYWDDAVAAMAVISRLIPVLFVYIFAMSGAVGWIIGQNLWANLISRVKETITTSFKFIIYYVLWVFILLFFSKNFIINLFELSWDGKELFIFYANFLTLFFIFNGFIFIWNALFNVIWKAYLSTIINIFKSIIILIPLVLLFNNWFGMKWILAAESLSFFISWMITLVFIYVFVFKENSLIDKNENNV